MLARAEGTPGTESQSVHLADAAMALLGCKSEDDVYRVIGDFMVVLCPEALIVVDEITPDMGFFITRRITGADASTLSKAAGLIGFEIVGKRWAIAPAFRDELLSGTLLRIPGGFAQLASSEIPKPISTALTKAFGICDLFAIGIADGNDALGNFAVVTRTPGVVLPAHIIESFARHCYSALASIHKDREIAEIAQSNSLMLRNMVEGLALHEVLYDENGRPCDYRYIDVNPAYEAATGLRADEIIGRTLLEVLPGSESSWFERFEAVVTTGIPSWFEEYSDDLAQYFEVIAYCPQPGQLATVGSDVTEKRKLEVALEEGDVRYRRLIKSMREGFAYCRLLFDDEGTPVDWVFLDANDRIDRSRSAEEITGRKASEVWPGVQKLVPDLFDVCCRVGMAGQPEEFDMQVAPGMWVHYSVTSPEKHHFVVVGSDISKRVNTEEALRESEEKYRTITESITDVVWVLDPETLRFLYVSPSVERLRGFTPEEILAAPLDAALTPDGARRLKALLTQQLESIASGDRSLDAAYTEEVEQPCKDGSTVWTEVVTSYHLNELTGRAEVHGVTRDIAERRRAEEIRRRDLERLRKALSSTVEIVGQVAETRDPYTAGHQRRVSELAVRISEGMGMSAEQTEEVRVASLLHDVGKMSIPAEILSKPGKLSDIEFELIKAHSEAGYRIIVSADMDGDVAEIVYQHHERCDGSGYPRGLVADELLPASKVLMVADVVEAMMSHRPYRPGLGVDAAMAEIEQGAGTLYDAGMVESCLRIFRENGFAFSEA
jgi:PAS domain S-box-containing protein/putative nucleotidyltransferase with HDIG domain